MTSVSIVTAVFNRETVIAGAIKSLQSQSHMDFEHLIIDGKSTDQTLSVIEKNTDARAKVWSAPDEGVYDALNKGFRLSTGDIVGILHSDDLFADAEVVGDVVRTFERTRADVVYGDLQYVSREDARRVIRHWTAGTYRAGRLRWGWMPPHPTFFIRRSLMSRIGDFDRAYRIAADYDFMIRCMREPGVAAAYIPRVLVRMRIGGESNRSLASIVRKSHEDWHVLRKNGFTGPQAAMALVSKNLRKLPQFIRVK